MSLKLLPLALMLVLALPLVAALPGVCGEDCRIDAASTGYAPPIAVIASGSSVTWHTVDITHVTRDQIIGPGAACFEVGAGRGQDAPAVRFDVTEAGLIATVEGESTTCSNALGAAAGYVLPYFCTIHPTMRGALVVTA